MHSKLKSRFVALLLAGVVPLATHASAHAASDAGSSAAVQSVWKQQEIRYTYTGFTVAYNCDAAETRLKNILLALGAHPQTKVRATGCYLNRPTKNFFLSITTATPVALADAKPQSPDKTAELVKKLGGKPGLGMGSEPFQATWQTVNLSRDRKLDLQPGDCELMQGLRDSVLPKLAIKIVTDRVQCTPRQLGIMTPELTVSALIAVASADKVKPVA